MNSPARAASFAPNPSSPLTPPPDFSRLAVFYRWLEWASFGPFLHLCRLAFLDRMETSRYALVLGDGDGRFTARLLANNPRIRVDAVDVSPAMLRAAADRAAKHASRLFTYAADIRGWSPAAGSPRRAYDLVVSHFFLDCLTTDEIIGLAKRIRPAMTPHAQWAISEFAIPDGSFGRWIARPLIAALYRAFGWLTGLPVRELPDHYRALHQSGFRLDRRRRFVAGLLISELWTVSSRTR